MSNAAEPAASMAAHPPASRPPPARQPAPVADPASAYPGLAIAPPPRPEGQAGRAPAAEAWAGEAERRRVALALLQEAARGQGKVTEDPASGTLLLRAPQSVLDRAAAVLEPLFAGRTTTLPPRIPTLRRPPPAPVAPPAEAAPLLGRRPILGLAAGGLPRLAGLRLILRPGSPGLPPAGKSPPHLLRHAQDELLRQGAEALAEGDAARLLGPSPRLPLHLDRPWGAAPLPPGLAGLPVLPVLPVARLAEGPPEGPFALGGLRAALLDLCEPAALPGVALHLAWDPALAARPGLVAALEPGRVVLEGVEEEAVLNWGLSLGIGRFVGGWAERVLESMP